MPAPVQQPPQASNPRLPFVSGVTLKDAEERIQLFEDNLKGHLKAIERAQEDGDLDKARIIQQEYTEKRLHIEKLKNIVNQYKQQLKQESPMLMAPTPQSQHQNQSPSSCFHPALDIFTQPYSCLAQHKSEVLGSPFVLNASKNLPTGNVPTVTTPHLPAGSEPGIRPSQNANVMNPAINLQMQKMFEQQQLTQHLGGLPPAAAMQSSNTSPPSGPAGLFPAPGIGVGGMGGASSAPGQQPHWSGILKWISDGSRQEMKCVVSLSNAMTVHKAFVFSFNLKLNSSSQRLSSLLSQACKHVAEHHDTSAWWKVLYGGVA